MGGWFVSREKSVGVVVVRGGLCSAVAFSHVVNIINS